MTNVNETKKKTKSIISKRVRQKAFRFEPLEENEIQARTFGLNEVEFAKAVPSPLQNSLRHISCDTILFFHWVGPERFCSHPIFSETQSNLLFEAGFNQSTAKSVINSDMRRVDARHQLFFLLEEDFCEIVYLGFKKSGK